MATVQVHWLRDAKKPFMVLFTTPSGNTTGEGSTWLEALGVAIERAVAVGDVKLDTVQAE